MPIQNQMRASAFLLAPWLAVQGLRVGGPCIYTLTPTVKTFSREHVVPVSAIRRADLPPSLIRVALADGHNIWPADRGVNSVRSNFTLVNHWGLSPNLDEWMVDTKAKVFAPPQASHGALARACLYMADKYGVDSDTAIDYGALRLWRERPVTKYELEHHTAILSKQGTVNPFVIFELAKLKF